MILKSSIAAMFASGLIVPETPKLEIPKPAIVKPENLDFSSHMFLLGMPITIGAFASQNDPAVSLILRNTTVDAQNIGTSTFTTAAMNIGTASSTRRVLAYITGNSASNSRAVNSVTIGGISATIHTQATSSSSGSTLTCIASATVPTGTTAVIEVTYNGTMSHVSANVTSLNNLNSTTPTYANSTTGTTGLSLSLTDVDWEGDGFVVGLVCLGLTPTVTWSGTVSLVEYIDTTIFGGNRRLSIADWFPTTGGTNQTATASWGSNPSRSAMSVVSFR